MHNSNSGCYTKSEQENHILTLYFEMGEQKMKKGCYYVLSILLIGFGLVGCGNQISSMPTEITEEYKQDQSEDDVNNNVQETIEVQENAEKQVEKDEIETTEESEQQLPIEEEKSTSSLSADIDDYWQGNDCFNLRGYLEANDYRNICAWGFDYEPLKNGETASSYDANTSDRLWLLHIITNSGVVLRYYGGDMSKPGGKFYFVKSEPDTAKVTVDETGMTIEKNTIKLLGEIVVFLKGQPDEAELVQYLESHYEYEIW